MNPLLKFLAAARSLASQGFKKEQIYDFAVREFGEVNPLMQKQIDNIFKPQKPITPKDPDFDNTVQKLGIDDQGKPFNPKDPLNNMATGGRAGYVEGGPIHPRLGELSSGVSSAEEQLQQINQSLQTAETSLGESGPGGAGSVTPSVNGYESSGSSLYNESPAGEVSNPYQAPVGMDPLQTPSTFMGKGGPEAFDNVPGAFNLKQNPYGNGNAMPATPIAVDSPSLTQTEDPARQAYADAQKSAQEIRAGGMMGQVVLPGEMNFEDFSNSGFNSFKPSGKLPSVGGGIGGLLGEGGGQQSTILPDENTAVTQGPGTGNSPPVYNSRPKLIDNTPEFKKSSDPIMGGFQESDFFKNMMGRPSTMDVQNYTLDGKEMSGSGTYFGGLRKYLESIGKGDLLQRNNNAYGNAGPLQSLAQGPGRAGYYMGGQAMVGEDLSEIGHGSDSLMARNMQLAPNGQATTSTGLNYLLGQDNDTARVPYKDAGPVVLPKEKPNSDFKSLLKIYNNYKDVMPGVSEDTQKYLAQDFINKLNEKGLSQTQFQTLRMQNHYEESKADGGRAGFSAGGFNAGRRGFLKLLGATTAGVAALKSGALKLLTAGKATSAIPKVISGTSGTPIWFENVVNKVLAEGIDATAKLAIKDGQIVKSLDTPTGKVDVYYDNKTGSVDLEYAGANTSMNEAVSMRYTPGVADEVTKGVKPADEFQASEVIPEFRGNAWDKRDRDLDAGENISNSKTLDDLYSDTSELSELGGEKLLIKDIAKTFKKKKELKTMNDNPEEFALENRYEPDYGDPMDYKE